MLYYESYFLLGIIIVSGSQGVSFNLGGGSGGSILICICVFEGLGVIVVNGGVGNSNGGGGVGGRMVIYWQDREWWCGFLIVFGGSFF